MMKNVFINVNVKYIIETVFDLGNIFVPDKWKEENTLFRFELLDAVTCVVVVLVVFDDSGDNTDTVKDFQRRKVGSDIDELENKMIPLIGFYL